jgi:hypothetical protein
VRGFMPPAGKVIKFKLNDESSLMRHRWARPPTYHAVLMVAWIFDYSSHSWPLLSRDKPHMQSPHDSFLNNNKSFQWHSIAAQQYDLTEMQK